MTTTDATPAPLPAFEQRLLDHLLVAHDEAASVASPRRPAQARRAPRSRLAGVPRAWQATAAGLTATAAAAVAAVLIASASTPPPATANTMLLAAATAAEQGSASTGAYWHVTITPAGEAARTETWTRRDGQVWLRSAKTGGNVVKLADVPFRLAGSEVSFEQLQALPTEPGALLASIADGVAHSDVTTSAGPPDAAQREQLAVDGLIALVTQLPAPPKVRAAAFRALAARPDVESAGAAQGGQRLRIALGEGRDATLVVDPATSQVTSTDAYVTADGAEIQLPGDGATVATGWTDELPAG